MITIDRFKSEYTPVHNKNFLASLLPADQVQMADMHAHSEFDSLSNRRKMMRRAASLGIDVVVFAEHNFFYDPRQHTEPLNLLRRLRDRDGIPVEPYSGSEISIQPYNNPANVKGEHILVYNQTQPIAPFGTWGELYVAAKKQDAKLIVAHPNFGDVSMSRLEIEQIFGTDHPPDGIEVFNGSAAQYDRFEHGISVVHNSRLIPDFLKDRFFQPGSNVEAGVIFDHLHREDPRISASGGSDAHGKEEIGSVVVVYKIGQDLYDALETGEMMIARRKEPTSLSIPMLAANLALGARMNRQVIRGLENARK